MGMRGRPLHNLNDSFTGTVRSGFVVKLSSLWTFQFLLLSRSHVRSAVWHRCLILVQSILNGGFPWKVCVGLLFVDRALD
jgi:hypothetical protein